MKCDSCKEHLSRYDECKNTECDLYGFVQHNDERQEYREQTLREISEENLIGGL